MIPSSNQAGSRACAASYPLPNKKAFPTEKQPGISTVVSSHSTTTEIFPVAEKNYHDQHLFPCDSNWQPNKTLQQTHLFPMKTVKDMLPL
jgi:hypothetical protein